MLMSIINEGRKCVIYEPINYDTFINQLTPYALKRLSGIDRLFKYSNYLKRQENKQVRCIRAFMKNGGK